MPLKIPWFEPKYRGFLILLLSFAAITQLIIIFIASYYFPINSVFVFVFISIGIVSLLMGAEILFAELIYTLRVRSRQKKPAKKKRKLRKISEALSIFIGAGISLGIFILVYFICAYFVIDPFVLTNLPIYGKFVLAEVLSGIILIILVLIFESAVPKN